VSDVKVGNISPVFVATTAHGAAYVLTFNKGALSWLGTGDVPVSVTARLTRNGRHGPAAATTTVRIER
jgi:hypothetical protein